MISRDELRAAYACPRCKAVKGEACRGKNGPRKSQHIERWNAAGVTQTDLGGAAYERAQRHVTRRIG